MAERCWTTLCSQKLFSIIAQVETQNRWAGMREIFMSICPSSTVLYCAILTFSSLLQCRRDKTSAHTTREYHARTVVESPKQEYQQIYEALERAAALATLFFLSYIDLLEGRNKSTHANLKKVFDIYQSSDKARFWPSRYGFSRGYN